MKKVGAPKGNQNRSKGDAARSVRSSVRLTKAESEGLKLRGKQVQQVFQVGLKLALEDAS
jgi:hypothetical protein